MILSDGMEFSAITRNGQSEKNNGFERDLCITAIMVRSGLFETEETEPFAWGAGNFEIPKSKSLSKSRVLVPSFATLRT